MGNATKASAEIMSEVASAEIMGKVESGHQRRGGSAACSASRVWPWPPQETPQAREMHQQREEEQGRGRKASQARPERGGGAGSPHLFSKPDVFPN